MHVRCAGWHQAAVEQSHGNNTPQLECCASGASARPICRQNGTRRQFNAVIAWTRRRGTPWNEQAQNEPWCRQDAVTWLLEQSCLATRIRPQAGTWHKAYWTKPGSHESSSVLFGCWSCSDRVEQHLPVDLLDLAPEVSPSEPLALIHHRRFVGVLIHHLQAAASSAPHTRDTLQQPQALLLNAPQASALRCSP